MVPTQRSQDFHGLSAASEVCIYEERTDPRRSIQTSPGWKDRRHAMVRGSQSQYWIVLGEPLSIVFRLEIPNLLERKIQKPTPKNQWFFSKDDIFGHLIHGVAKKTAQKARILVHPCFDAMFAFIVFWLQPIQFHRSCAISDGIAGRKLCAKSMWGDSKHCSLADSTRKLPSVQLLPWYVSGVYWNRCAELHWTSPGPEWTQNSRGERFSESAGKPGGLPNWTLCLHSPFLGRACNSLSGTRPGFLLLRRCLAEIRVVGRWVRSRVVSMLLHTLYQYYLYDITSIWD